MLKYVVLPIVKLLTSTSSFSFHHHNNHHSPTLLMNKDIQQSILPKSIASNKERSISRRTTLHALGGSSFFSNLFNNANAASNKSKAGVTNEVCKVVEGMKWKRMGGSDIIVSEMGLGTQRWVSSDYNAPNEEQCYSFLDYAILENGVNLIDTAEQYPIPSDANNPEGNTERVIGKWIKDRNLPRDKVVIATKITGGKNITPKNIIKDCEGSLRRLETDYIDIYQLHWPFHYSPQSNWGQSLQYNLEIDANPYWRQLGITYEDLCLSMQGLIDKGKIRGWGLCNDNAHGLTACTRTAKMLGTTPPCSFQGDFSLIDRKSEENGVAEAASPYHENVGFMAYNALAGGMLTGKYLSTPAALDNTNDTNLISKYLQSPRGRMDTRGWGGTLYRYRTTPATQAIQQYNQIANQNKLSLTELSLRWARQRSLVTTSLIGTSNMKQLQECITCFKTKDLLSTQIMWDIDRVHMKNRLPIFSNDRVGKDWFGEGEIGEPIP